LLVVLRTRRDHGFDIAVSGTLAKSSALGGATVFPA